MKYMSLFQRIFFYALGIFGSLALVLSILINTVSMAMPVMGFGIIVVFGQLSLVWMTSTAITIYLLLVLTQYRPLYKGSILTTILSLAGITLMTLGGLYVVVTYGLAFAGIETHSALWAFASLCVKHLIVLGILLMFSAFVFSYKPVRVKLFRSVAFVCALICGVFISSDLLYPPAEYEPFILFFGASALGAAFTIVIHSKRISNSS